jgi:PAS domain S-box-containing protein
VSSDLYREEDLRIFAVASEQMAVAISRKRADDALRESEKKYRHIFKHAPAGICEIDFERLKLIAVNDILCEYTGYSEQELLAMNPMTLLTENSKNIQIERLEQLYRSKRSTSSVEHDIVRKNGEKLTVILNSDFDYQNGKLKAARIVVHDISRLKKAEAEKINAQKFAEEQKKLALVGRIAGKMAHDFNNILGIIMGNTELLLMDCKDEGAKKTLELIFSQTMRGKNLTKNLVAFARDQEPRQEFFRINEKIDLVLRLLKKDLEGIEVMVENEPDLPDLLADPGMIEHALVNLIQNSIHAVGMAEHPMISIRTSRCDTNICFEIQDNGCGIPREHLDSIYEPSFTLKGGKDVTGSYKKAIRGTGYGMSNVKKYIEQHRGNISLESTFGSGTRFTIHLPVVQKELTPLEKTKLQTEKTHVNRNILLVEDEQDISGVQQRILTQPPCSHRVDLAQTGQAAVDLFGKNRYDLVSLDYALPGKMNGMDVYHHIRSIDPSIPILFISGNIEFLESIKELKQQDPHIDHLSKPCRNIAYINRIDQLLEKTSS